MIGNGFIVAGKPSGLGIQHLFRRPGEWSLCEEAVWLEVQRAELVTELTWICARCKALGEGRPDPCPEESPVGLPGLPKACPYCGGQLTVPQRLPVANPDRVWECADCGRLHCEGSVPLDYELPKPSGRLVNGQRVPD